MFVRIIKEPTLLNYGLKHADVEAVLRKWITVVRRADWKCIDDVRTSYPHADAVKVTGGNIVTVFNIGGNKYRLIVAIHYNHGLIYVLRFFTHAEYSKNAWKEVL